MSDTLNTILTAIGTFFAAFLEWVGSVVTFILAIASIVISMVRSWIPGAGV